MLGNRIRTLFKVQCWQRKRKMDLGEFPASQGYIVKIVRSCLSKKKKKLHILPNKLFLNKTHNLNQANFSKEIYISIAKCPIRGR